jgi:hypothetical protein
MTTSQPDLVELAKQGDAQAIAALMNHHLQPKGIYAKTASQDGCLYIKLEGDQLPRQAVTTFIRKGMTGLAASSIERVKVYGQRTGDWLPAWSEEFQLPNPPIAGEQNAANFNHRQKPTPAKPIVSISIPTADGEQEVVSEQHVPVQVEPDRRAAASRQPVSGYVGFAVIVGSLLLIVAAFNWLSQTPDSTSESERQELNQ